MANSKNVIDVSEATFEQEVIQGSHDRPVLVDFWAPWCGPCRMLGPILEKLANEPNAGFLLAKVNSDLNQSISRQYQIQGIPAVKAFVNGQVVAEFVGVRPEPFIRQFLAELMPQMSGTDLSAGMSALHKQAWQEAESHFRALLDESPEHDDAIIGLTRAILAQGQGVEAERLLKLVKAGNAYAAAEKLRPLASYLVSAELDWSDDDEITPLESQYRHAAQLLRRSNIAAALDGLLDVLRVNKRYRKGKAKEVVLAVLTLLGDDNSLARQYRQELASVLF